MAGRIVFIHDGRLLIDNALDNLREKFSLALVPRPSDGRPPRLSTLPACLSVQERGGAIHAIFRLEPGECRTMLARELGMPDAHCTPIGLEDMFVELVGGRS